MIAVMRFLIRALLFLVVVGGLACGGAYLYAGTLPGPAIVALRAPEKYVGQNTQLEFSVETPDGQFTNIDAVLEQEGQIDHGVLDRSERSSRQAR